MKIAACDFTRYGTIAGKITDISRDVEGAMPSKRLIRWR